MSDEAKYLTPAETSVVAGVTPATVFNWIKNKKVNSKRSTQFNMWLVAKDAKLAKAIEDYAAWKSGKRGRRIQNKEVSA